MPTYEYVCTSCATHVEAVQSFSDDPLTTCAECGGSLRKVFGSIGIVLKGSGFYKTDSRAADAATVGKSADRSGGESSGGSKDAGSSSSTDAKPSPSSGDKAGTTSTSSSSGTTKKAESASPSS